MQDFFMRLATTSGHGKRVRSSLLTANVIINYLYKIYTPYTLATFCNMDPSSIILHRRKYNELFQYVY